MCIDTPASYKCKCKANYRDGSPAGQEGRICLLDECANPNLNGCDKKNAECHDTEDSYYCVCKDNFFDNSPNPAEPGRVCLPVKERMKFKNFSQIINHF